jgi:hypothetical protein
MTTGTQAPDNADKIVYNSLSGSGTYYIWLSEFGFWCWAALGNSGKAVTRYDAEQQAKRWIRSEH